MAQSDRYAEYFERKQQEDELRRLQESQAGMEPVEDLSVGPTTGVVESGKTSPAAFSAARSQQEGQGTQAAGTTLMTAAPATGPAAPYVAGAGLALQTASMINQGRANRRKMAYEAELQKVQARQNAINKMAEIGRGLKV
jgi:hypothetical protein